MPLTFALSPVQFIFLIHSFCLADSTPGGLLDFSKKHSTQDDFFFKHASIITKTQLKSLKTIKYKKTQKQTRG